MQHPMKLNGKPDQVKSKAGTPDSCRSPSVQHESAKESSRGIVRREADILRNLQKRADALIQKSERGDHWTTASS